MLRRLTLEHVGLVLAAIIGVLPGARDLLTNQVLGGEAALGSSSPSLR
ncbi:MAG: hypothetical protein SFW67_01450 [Myxococcaceae bacterium]|nr:hypothetical protein [Myxococcaceae bacterium]